MKDWYKSEEADPDNFEQWEDLNDDEKEDENPWDHVMPYIKFDQIKMLKNGLSKNLDLTSQRRAEPPAIREKRIALENARLQRERKKIEEEMELERYRQVGERMKQNKQNLIEKNIQFRRSSLKRKYSSM